MSFLMSSHPCVGVLHNHNIDAKSPSGAFVQKESCDHI